MKTAFRIGMILLVVFEAFRTLWPSVAQPPAAPLAPAAEDNRPEPARKVRPRKILPDSSKPASALSEPEFREITARALEELPTAESLRELTDEEVHETPKPLLQAGIQLGQIAQAVEEQPALGKAAAEFYVRCTEKPELLTQVRALCYSHVLDSSQAPRPESLPSEVVRLARLIPAS